MNVLYLTQREQALFDGLSDSLKEGWSTETETLTYDDSPQRQIIRLSLIRIHDPALLKLRDKAQKMSSEKELVTLIQEHDLKHVNEDDLAELFFALGPTALTELIINQLVQVGSDHEMEQVTALTTIRHALLTSFQPVV